MTHMKIIKDPCMDNENCQILVQTSYNILINLPAIAFRLYISVIIKKRCQNMF